MRPVHTLLNAYRGARQQDEESVAQDRYFQSERHLPHLPHLHPSQRLRLRHGEKLPFHIIFIFILYLYLFLFLREIPSKQFSTNFIIDMIE